MDHVKFQKLIGRIYEIVSELEKMFPGRHFTPDGHMVGSLGECLVADAYGLELMPASNRGFDAKSSDKREVEIKATQSSRVGFRSCSKHVIVIQIQKDGSFEECFNGPGKIIWNEFKGRMLPSNGQHQISLAKIRKLNQTVNNSARVKRLHHHTNTKSA